MTEVMFHEHQWARLATLATGTDSTVLWGPWYCPVCGVVWVLVEVSELA